MNETQQKATYYFQSYTDYFWQWEIDHMFNSNVIENVQDYQGGINCISIPDGITIAYKEQLQELLNALSETGFPPFGTLILTFLATNSGEVDIAIDEIFKEKLKKHIHIHDGKHIKFTNARKFLKTLISLPATYKSGKNKIELFMFLFKDGNHNLPKKHSDTMLTCLKNKAFELNECSRKIAIPVTTLSKDINALALLHEQYPTVNDLLKAWGKIIPIEIDPDDAEVASISQDPELIQQLIEDPKTFFMGNLIKQIWSGIQLPMHYVHPGEMPLGGISDITNKGNFDNLLISEYANDDLVFLHRIANKEALFIRRETTPEEDLRTRVFLIDTTIKNWGTPKILSFATAFALIHHPKNEMNFQTYAIGKTYQSLVFNEKEHIIKGLQLTSPFIDASSAMLKFISECEEENVEITLFTSPKTLQHQTVQRDFNLHHDKFGGIITADTSGNIDVYKLKNGAKRLVKHIQLPLEELWAKPPSTGSKQTQNTRKSEPIIEYPLLYGYPNGYLTHFFDVEDGYVLQKRGLLYKTNGAERGFELIKNDVRFVRGIKKPMVATFYEDELIILTWNSLKEIVIKGELETITFAGYFNDQYLAALKNLLFHEGELYLITKKHYSGEAVYLKINILHEFSEEITTPSTELQEAYDSCLSNYFGYFPGSVFTKVRTITITKKLEFIFNNLHKLKFEDDYISFELDRSQEALAAVSEFVTKTEFMFSNRSKITIDKKGILVFSSPNPALETFYIASYIDVSLGMATATEFAGNDYFMPKDSNLNIISIKDFKRKYIDPFIVNIVTT
jgi:hypothetical protein